MPNQTYGAARNSPAADRLQAIRAPREGSSERHTHMHYPASEIQGMRTWWQTDRINKYASEVSNCRGLSLAFPSKVRCVNPCFPPLPLPALQSIS